MFNRPKCEVENHRSILNKSKAFDVPVQGVYNCELAFLILHYDKFQICTAFVQNSYVGTLKPFQKQDKKKYYG